jgi:phosphotransferase system  glucose/maltose/N-acetylglucosamine-specific IIC component
MNTRYNSLLKRVSHFFRGDLLFVLIRVISLIVLVLLILVMISGSGILGTDLFLILGWGHPGDLFEHLVEGGF